MKGRIYQEGNGYRVRFGRKIQKRFQNLDEAERFLTGLRFKQDEGTLDRRDYRKDNPLAFDKQAEKWLATKTCSKSHMHNLGYFIGLAGKSWRGRNVKSLTYGDVEDLINAQTFGAKTKHEMVSSLRQFFRWLEQREGIKAPAMPKVEFTLGWREIIDLDTQAAILDELHRIAPMRIWLGIKWLATYIAIRPNEMRMLRERDVNVNGMLVCRPQTTKERKPKIVPMVEEDIALVKALPKGLPDLFFFRHADGAQIGPRSFYQWWCRACERIGVKGVDLYGGTRHSSATAMAEFFGADQLRQHGTMHGTNKAFERYVQREAAPSREIYERLSSRRPDPTQSRAQ